MFAIESERFRDEIVLAARTLLVVLFLIFGWNQLTNYDAAANYMVMTGAPAPHIAAAIAITIECLVSVAVLFGIFTRPLAALMVVYTLATS
jgi:putative oxidoreductase